MAETKYPGAVWKPVAEQHREMKEIRGVSFHIAVTRQEESIFGWAQSANPCHFYVGRYGTCEQYQPVGAIVAGTYEGNSTMITVETWDGLDVRTEKTVDGRGPNDSVWTAEQCARLADLAAWFKREWGVPIRLMASSKKTERGFAPHRWGIDPWRLKLGGGETWTRAPGKQCPGNFRVEQIPMILAHAQVLSNVESYRPYPPGRITVEQLKPQRVQPTVLVPEEEEDMGVLIIAIDTNGVVWRTRDFITKTWVGPGTKVLEDLIWIERLAGRTPQLWIGHEGNEFVDLSDPKAAVAMLDSAYRIKPDDPAFGVSVGLIPREPEEVES